MSLLSNKKLAQQAFSLREKVVLITGAAGGIGSALARLALARGATVALTDVAADRLAEVARSLGAADRLSTHVADLTDSAAVQRLVQEVVEQYGRIDVLANVAGVSMAGRFTDSDLEEFNRVMAINVTAIVDLTYAALPHMPAGGHIINVSSSSGLVGMPFSTAYSASKFAVRGLTDALRTEVVWQGIGVTLVHPGGINTGLKDRLWYGKNVPEAEKRQLQQAAAKSMKTTPSAVAAGQILDGAQRRRARVVVGLDAKAMDAAIRLLPVTLNTLLGGMTKPKR